MARATQRRRGRLAAAPRRARYWARETGQFSTLAGGLVVSDLLQDFKAELGVTKMVPGSTIMGGFLSWAWVPTADVGANELAEVTLGIRVIGEDTFNQVDSPEDAGRHDDWMWWQQAYSSAPRRAIFFDGSTSPMLRWKARRRMDELGQNLALAVHTSHAGVINFACSTLVFPA